MRDKINIVLIEGHDLLRKTLRDSLNLEQLFEVMICASRGADVLSSNDLSSCNIVILDIHSSDAGSTLRILQEKHPNLKIIVTSMFYSEQYIHNYFPQGAQGYLSKDEQPHFFSTAIHCIAQDGFFLYPFTSKGTLRSILHQQLVYLPASPVQPLESREVELIKILCVVKRDENLAEKANLTTEECEQLLRGITTKTCLHSTAGMLLFAMQQGICS